MRGEWWKVALGGGGHQRQNNPRAAAGPETVTGTRAAPRPEMVANQKVAPRPELIPHANCLTADPELCISIYQARANLQPDCVRQSEC